jgi:hypothetical protein
MWYKHKKVSYELHYDYCQNTESTYRTVSWIPANTTSGKVFTYDLKLKNSLPFMNNSVSLKSHSYFATTTVDYQTYIDERDIDLYQVGNNQNKNAYITNASLLRGASLKQSNFTYTVGNPYKNSDGYYYVTISYTYKNKAGVNPYYFPTVGYDILFTPIKFTITAAQDNKCTKDASSNSHKYTNHTKINPIYDYVVTYVWTKNIFEPNLIYTGISEAR